VAQNPDLKPFECVQAVIHRSEGVPITKPREDRETIPVQVAPIVALLVLVVANGHELVVTMQPVCG
jgi:hypothetical protein